MLRPSLTPLGKLLVTQGPKSSKHSSSPETSSYEGTPAVRTENKHPSPQGHVACHVKFRPAFEPRSSRERQTLCRSLLPHAADPTWASPHGSRHWKGYSLMAPERVPMARMCSEGL